MNTTTPRKRGTKDTTATDPPPDDQHDNDTDELDRPVALPTRDFADVLEYLGEWESVDGAASTRFDARREPTGRLVGGNEIGPYCAITLSQLGGPEHRAIAARVTDATLAALCPRIVTDNDSLTFHLVGHEQTGRVLVIARHGKIIGDHWLAYVDADTLPHYPYRQRDERVAETCQTLRDNGHSPYVRRLEDSVIEVEPAEHGTKIKASIDALGAVTRTWGNGSSIVEPPRDSDEARRAAEQLERHPPNHPTANAAVKANGGPAQAPAQQSLLNDETAATPVRRSTVEDTVVEVLARAEVTDDLVVLPAQLDRALYEKVNKALTALGGKWNRRRGGHVFPPGQPIGDELAQIVDGGVLERMLTGYFPTPRPLAERLIALADVRSEHLVLEPSAGRGAIADLLAKVVPAERLYLVERSLTHHQALQRAGYRAPQLVCDDFLTTTVLPETFDRIVMNPPFEQQQDVKHVMRAYELLAPGGRLTAITSAGVAFRTDKRTSALRELIEHSDGGSIAENQPDAFKSSGTSVNTLTVALTKPTA